MPLNNAGLRLLVAVVTICVLAGVWRLSTGDASMPFTRNASDHSALEGVWRSRGYGWLWHVRDGRLRIYDQSGTYCVPSAQSQDLDALADDIRMSEGGRTFHLALYDPTYEFVFDKIAVLPAACTRKPDASPAAVIDALEEIFSAHYAFFRARKIDWPAIVRAAKAKVDADTSDEDLLEVLGKLIARFPDDHVSLRARVDDEKVVLNTGVGTVLESVADQARREDVDFNEMVERWKKRVWTKDFETKLLGDGARTAGNGNIKYGLIDGDIGFLAILAMDDFAKDDDDNAVALGEALDAAMALFKRAKAVIVDVSINDGGHDHLARQIAARFAGKRTLGYSKYPGDSPVREPQAIYVEPSDGARYTGPVYLMTSNVTVSAAEIFTMVMRALPNVTHVGQATRGSLSDVLTKQLPNKWQITLSNEVYLDADGKAWEGAGIPPKVPIQVFPGDDATATPLQAFRAVVKCIRARQCPGS